MLGKDRTLLAALHIKLLKGEATLAAILAHPRARAAFAGFVEKVCSDHHSLDAYEAMHAYAQLAPSGLEAAARSVGESITSEFLREPAPREIQLSADVRRQVLERIPRDADSAWPPALFKPAEAELDGLLRREYMPQFMGHSVFPHVLNLLGAYEAEALFPSQVLPAAKAELVRSIEEHQSGAAVHFLDLGA